MIIGNMTVVNFKKGSYSQSIDIGTLRGSTCSISQANAIPDDD